LETIDREQDLTVEFDQGGAVLAEAAVVLGEVAEVGSITGGQRTQTGLASLGPGKHAGGVKWALWGEAVAGRLAAAGLQFIDGAFEKLAKRQQVFESLLIVGQQRPQGLAQMAGALGGGGQELVLPLCCISQQHKEVNMFFEKNEGGTKLCLAGAETGFLEV
jgi:hypothetical protein